jgi:hypothetical protein
MNIKMRMPKFHTNLSERAVNRLVATPNKKADLYFDSRVLREEIPATDIRTVLRLRRR